MDQKTKATMDIARAEMARQEEQDQLNLERFEIIVAEEQSANESGSHPEDRILKVQYRGTTEPYWIQYTRQTHGREKPERRLWDDGQEWMPIEYSPNLKTFVYNQEPLPNRVCG